MSDSGYRKLLRGIRNDKREIIVVTGAPGSGKSTYVRENAGRDDLVVDLDSISTAIQGGNSEHKDHGSVLDASLKIRELLYQEIISQEGKWKRAFVISASPDPMKVRDLIRKLDGKEHRMETTREQCIRQIKNDESRHGREELYIQLANQWYDAMT